MQLSKIQLIAFFTARVCETPSTSNKYEAHNLAAVHALKAKPGLAQIVVGQTWAAPSQSTNLRFFISPSRYKGQLISECMRLNLRKADRIHGLY